MEASNLYRRPKHLSPSALAVFRSNIDEYYLRYLCHHKSPRFAQTEPMAIGSAFDAYAKHDLNTKLFGNNRDPKFDFDNLFPAQVEPQNRDWAKEHGKLVYQQYLDSGSFADLLIELEGAIGQPRLEAEVFGVVQGYREGVTETINGIPLLGKPDVYFINKHGASVILDWKVNGYLSKWGVSPAPCYIRLKEKGKETKAHIGCQLGYHKGIMVNISQTLEYVNGEWADQLSIYAWLCGEQIGSKFVAAIDQVVCRPGNIRFAQHRSLISEIYQYEVFKNAQKVWEIAQSDHIFRDLTIEESQERCKLLDQQAIQITQAKPDDLFSELTRIQ